MRLPVLLLVAALAQREENGRKISAVTVLLPHTDASARKVPFELTASGGCYEWASMRPDIISIDGECDKAIVSSVAPSNATEKSVISASDPTSDTEMRCEIYSAAITQIEVVTRANRINVHDVETLSVQARDAHGNVFSSLEGLRFSWIIKDQNVLRKVPLTETEIAMSPVRKEIEDAGFQSDVIVVKGLATGKTAVQVRLDVEAPYDLSSKVVTLSILEPLMAVPALVYVAPVSHLSMGLKILKPNVPISSLPLVELPQPHFEWSCDEKVASINNAGRAVATSLGNTELKVSDLRIADNHAVSFMRVVTPNFLQISVMPLDGKPGENWVPPPMKGTNNWELVIDRYYMVSVQVFDKDSHEMFVSDNFLFNFLCTDGNKEGKGKCPLEKIWISGNEAVVVLNTSKLGKGTITFVADKVEADEEDKAAGLKSLKLDLQKSVTINVNPQVELSVDSLILPPAHHFPINIKGGSGEYFFKSDPACLANATGVRSTTEGVSHIVISDKKNPLNNASLQCTVAPLKDVVLRPESKQIPLGSHSLVPIVGVPDLPFEAEYDACSLDFDLHSTSTDVATVNIATGEEAGTYGHGICGVAAINSLTIGTFVVTAEYKEMRGSAVFEVFYPLAIRFDIAMEPMEGANWGGESARAPLYLGTDAAVEFDVVGGPPNGEDKVSSDLNIELLRDRRYRLSCSDKPSITEVEAVTSNGVASVTVQAYIVCDTPTSVRVFPLRAKDRNAVIENSVHAVPMMDHPLILLGIGQQPLVAIAADITWTLDGETYGEGVSRSVHMHPTNQMTLKATTSINLHTSFSLVPSYPPEWSWHNLALPFHPDWAYQLNLGHGSGRPVLNIANPEVHAIKPEDRVSLVSIRDDLQPSTPICLGVDEPAVTTLTLTDPSLLGYDELLTREVSFQPAASLSMSVDMMAANDTSLIENQHYVLDLQAYDVLGRPLEGLHVLDLKVVSEFVYKKDDQWILHPTKLGTFTVFASLANAGSDDLVTARLVIKVFPPLQLLPNQLVLMPGHTYEFDIIGGPAADSDVVYTSSDESIVSVSPNGLLMTHALGNVTIRAQKDNAVASGTVIVALPHQAAIVGTAPLVGREQRLLAMLYNKDKLAFELPHLAIAGCDFAWTSSEPSMLAVNGNLRGSMLGLRGGNVKVDLNAFCRIDGWDSISLSASAEYIIKEPLQIVSPEVPVCNGVASVTIPLGEQFKFKLNRAASLWSNLPINKTDTGFELLSDVEADGIIRLSADSEVLTVAVRARRPVALQFTGIQTISVGSRATLKLQLSDRESVAMLTPTVALKASHPSVLAPEGQTVRALKSGCASVEAAVLGLRDVLRICAEEEEDLLLNVGGTVYFLEEPGKKIQYSLRMDDPTKVQDVLTSLQMQASNLSVDGSVVTFSATERPNLANWRNLPVDRAYGIRPVVRASSSDPDVAVVDMNGMVTAVAEGSTTIRLETTARRVRVTQAKVLLDGIFKDQKRVDHVTNGETYHIPVKYIAAQKRELSSSPLVHQRLAVSCEPKVAIFKELFEFIMEENECILRPLAVNFEIVPPSSLTVLVGSASVTLPFLPLAIDTHSLTLPASLKVWGAQITYEEVEGVHVESTFERTWTRLDITAENMKDKTFEWQIRSGSRSITIPVYAPGSEGCGVCFWSILAFTLLVIAGSIWYMRPKKSRSINTPFKKRDIHSLSPQKHMLAGPTTFTPHEPSFDYQPSAQTPDYARRTSTSFYG